MTHSSDNDLRHTPATNPSPISPTTQGFLAEISDALSHETTLGYDNYGRRTTVTNHEGKPTTTAYDHLDRVSVTTPDPDGAGGVTASPHLHNRPAGAGHADR